MAKLECEYYSSGKVKSKVYIVNGKKKGIYTQYFESGQILMTIPYSNDIMNGIQYVYYRNGKLAQESSFIDGKRQGKHIQYYENGQVSVSMEYKEDISDDNKFESYTENGEFCSLQKYIEGYTNGYF